MLSNHATSELVDHVFRANITPPSTLYVALCTEIPEVGDTGSDITEISYTNYARMLIPTQSTFFDAAGTTSIRAIVQQDLLEFANEAGTNGNANATHYAICSAITGGDLLGFGTLNGGTGYAISSGNTPRIPAGEIVIDIGAAGTAGFTDWACEQLLNLMFRGVAWNIAGNLHAGLASVAVEEDDSDGDSDITECTGTDYAREPVPAASFATPASAGVIANTTAVTFDTPGASGWTSMVSVFIADALAAASSNVVAYNDISSQDINENDEISIPIGDFDMDLD